MKYLLMVLVLIMASPRVQAAEAVFAGGCFWCMESDFERLEGVSGAEAGYTGGHVPNPTYEQVSAGDTGHREAIRVSYDPAKISYQDLLDVFWVNVDPFDEEGQFCDKGEQYLSAIYYADETEQKLAEQSLRGVEEKFGRKVATGLYPASVFYVAEEKHQDYFRNNPLKYRFYRSNCGRDDRLEDVWGESPKAESKGQPHQ